MPKRSKQNVRKTKKKNMRGMDVISSPDVGLRPGFKNPMPFSVQPIMFRKLRFTVAGAVATQAYTASNILDFLCMSTAANVAYRIARSVRLKYVEIWEPFNGVGNITNVSLKWDIPTTANLPMNSTTIYASSSGPDYPAHLFCRPSRDTYADWWHNASDTGPMFTLLSLNAGAIVDIAFDYVTYETGNSTQTSTGVTVAAGGFNAIHSPNASITALGLFDI